MLIAKNSKLSAYPMDEFELLKVGHCYHPEAIVSKGSSWKAALFPSIVGLMKHPMFGNILFDTGYADRFKDVTQSFPERLYRWTTPMTLPGKEFLLVQLMQRKISKEDINYIFISHFHADHIAGLLDYPNAKLIYSVEALANFKELSRLKRLVKGYLYDLLPKDISDRSILIEELKIISLPKSMSPFTVGYDVFKDGSCIAIELPGHARGHMGLLTYQDNKVKFLIGDACWTSNAFKVGCKPNPLAHLVMHNTDQYYETIENISNLFGSNKEIQIIPSHCLKTFESLQNG